MESRRETTVLITIGIFPKLAFRGSITVEFLKSFFGAFVKPYPNFCEIVHNILIMETWQTRWLFESFID